MKNRTFENGFRLVYKKSFHGSNAASIQVICDVGSIHEAADSRGSAHFIEHMCFKGTQIHPSTFEISTIIDKTGSNINAFTEKRYTKYYIDTNTESVAEYIHLLSDMLLNSVFDKKEYDKEKDVVREEMIKDADDAEIVVLENADGVIFAGSPFEHPVDELKYHVGKNVLQYDKIVKMYRDFYVPNRMILSVCSANSFESICAAVSRSFFVKGMVVACPSSPIVSLARQADIVYKVVKMPINPAHICVGFRTCSVYDKDRYVLKLLRRILSGSLSSRLFMILREENGLTYSSYTSGDYYEHLGSFLFYAQCDPEKIFRNVMLKFPFTLISNKNSLNRFRKLGFKTFDCVIDESYDTLEDSIRYKESIQSAKELLKFYNDKKVQDVLDYNFNLLIDKTNIHNKFDSLFLNPLKKHIKNLSDEKMILWTSLAYNFSK